VERFTRRILVDALDILKQQHLEAHAAFEDIKTAPANGRGGVWADLRPKLELHEQIEERFVYDPVAHDAGSRDPVLARWEQEHEDQVSDADALMAEIDALEPADAQWLERVGALASTLDEHIAHEENDIWPRIRAAWDEDKLIHAGRQMAEAKSSVERGIPIEEAVDAGEGAQ
jgi:hemerythrin superfamily protein